MANEGKVKISDLSFYEEPRKAKYAVQKSEAGLVQGGFKTAREVTTEGINLYTEARESVSHVIETGVAHSTGAYSQLREEENLPARLALISGAGLLGLMVGAVRGRIFKKLLYSGIGAGAGVAFCYPEDAREGANIAYEEGRKAALDGYNLIAGGQSESIISQICFLLISEC